MIRKKILDPIAREIKQGLDAEGLARSLLVGLLGGLFPIPGVTAVVCYLLHRLCRTNLVVVQVLNLCVTPLQLSFAVFALGVAARSFPPSPDFDASDFFASFATRLGESPAAFLAETGVLLLWTCALWAVLALLSFIPLYLICVFITRKCIPSKSKVN